MTVVDCQIGTIQFITNVADSISSVKLKKFDKVWLLDVRDVVFQADPFQLANDGLIVTKGRRRVCCRGSR